MNRPNTDMEVVAADRNAAARRAAFWLSLAAAPTFAVMALLTSARGEGGADMLCMAAQHSSPLNGMVAMYLLMTVFHLAPWLKLVSGRRDGLFRPEIAP